MPVRPAVLLTLSYFTPGDTNDFAGAVRQHSNPSTKLNASTLFSIPLLGVWGATEQKPGLTGSRLRTLLRDNMLQDITCLTPITVILVTNRLSDRSVEGN